MLTGHVFIATSLDGFIARPDGDIEWLLSRDLPGEDHGYDAFIKDMDGILMGRGSFEKVLTFEKWPYSRPVVVLSATLKTTDVPTSLRDQVRILNQTPRAVFEFLEKEGWRKVYVDGGRVIQSCLREKLIQDLVVTRVPVLIGRGISLFGEQASDISLTHLATRAFPSGLVQSTYRVEP